MKTYQVTRPLVGSIVFTVYADSEEEALEISGTCPFNVEIKYDSSDKRVSGVDINEIETPRCVVEGNVFHGYCNEVTCELVEEDEEK